MIPPTYLRTLALVASSALQVSVFALSAHAAPPPLSADSSPVNIASTYGSGNFGQWAVDSWGLPAYDYTIDEESNPIAKQPELSGAVDAWSQLGNDHIVADAFNHGYVQLWSQDRLYQWMNYYDASHQHYAGGFGYLNVGGKVTLDAVRRSSGWRHAPSGSSASATTPSRPPSPGISEKDAVYAPFGDDSLLLHDVTITNTSSVTRSGSYFEYWDVNPEVIAAGNAVPRGYGSPVWDPATRTLSVAQLPDDVDTAAADHLCQRAERTRLGLRHGHQRVLRLGNPGAIRRRCRPAS